MCGMYRNLRQAVVLSPFETTRTAGCKRGSKLSTYSQLILDSDGMNAYAGFSLPIVYSTRIPEVETLVNDISHDICIFILISSHQL